MILRILLAFSLASAGLTLVSDRVDAKRANKAKTGLVRLEYVAPKNPEHQTVYEQLKNSRVLEHVRELMSPFRLPAPLLLKTEGCDGVANAWYHDRVVIVCYEYIADAIKNAPHQPVAEVTREATIVGAVMDVFLHEIAHALFEMLEIPVLGREEDAADQLAAYVMLALGPKKARSLIGGVAYLYAIDAMKTGAHVKDFADVHGLPAQRLYNLLCMAYGSSPKAYEDIVKKGYLPKERAEGCEAEYAQVQHAFETLIVPHLNRKLHARVRTKVRAHEWKRLAPPLAK